jgi:hypothetical protein
MGPDGGGLGKAAGELMREMQKMQIDMQQQQQGQRIPGSAKLFTEILAQKAQAVQVAKKTSALAHAAQVLRTAKAEAKLVARKVAGAAQAQRSRTAEMIERLIDGQDRMNKIMSLALSGRQFSPVELISMQAGVYRFAQELELTSKVVEKGTSSIKQTMNTQV